jgi:hypothetical protein
MDGYSRLSAIILLGGFLEFTPVITSAQAVNTYDGIYSGTMTTTQQADARSPCGQTFNKTMRITNGAFSFPYNTTFSQVLSGTVAVDGSLSGFMNSTTGGIRLAAKIQGGDLVGQVASGVCAYALQLRRIG